MKNKVKAATSLFANPATLFNFARCLDILCSWVLASLENTKTEVFYGSNKKQPYRMKQNTEE